MNVPRTMNSNKSIRRIPAVLIGIALGMTILCSCRSPSGKIAGMKLGNDGEQAYVVADKPISQETSSRRILPRIAGMRTNKTPAAETNPVADS